ncbi:MAG: dynamin family protein [Actinobacteria bacterium]|nr:dynamin family protein [Actinomycetota bacterium]
MSPSLRQAVIAVCDDALRLLPEGAARDGVLHVRQSTTEPLRVAVSGSVSSGKSTLVNALLGQRIAAVDQGECTNIVTWFRYDHHERIVVEHRDGTTATLALEDGHKIPDDLGAPAEAIERVVVHLSNDRLRGLTIIDTPGLNTVTGANEASTSDLLGLDDDSQVAVDSRAAMTQADALVFLMPHVRAHDARVLTQFRSLFEGTGLSAVNVVGVLSKIDKLTPDGDPWPTARRLAERGHQELRAVLSDVIPVNGLLAETAATDRYSEEDTLALKELALIDELDLEDQLLTQADFLEAAEPAELTRERRTRLLAMLDLHGITLATRAVEAGTGSTRELLLLFREQSGFEPLAQTVNELFARRAEALKAHAALGALRRLTATRKDDEPLDPDERRTVARALERIELAPELHDLRLFEVLGRVEHGDVRLPDDLIDDLRRLAIETEPELRVGLTRGASDAEVRAAAAAGAKTWSRWGNDPRRSPTQERFAEDVRTAYELLWQSARPDPIDAAPAEPEAGGTGE